MRHNTQSFLWKEAIGSQKFRISWYSGRWWQPRGRPSQPLQLASLGDDSSKFIPTRWTVASRQGGSRLAWLASNWKGSIISTKIVKNIQQWKRGDDEAWLALCNSYNMRKLLNCWPLHNCDGQPLVCPEDVQCASILSKRKCAKWV